MLNRRKSSKKSDSSEKYSAISGSLKGIQINTKRTDSIDRLNQGIIEIKKDKELSDDVKIIALFGVFVREYNRIVKSFGGANSNLGKYIKNFCAQNFGVVLDPALSHHFDPGSLILQILNSFGIKPSNENPSEEASLLKTNTRRANEVEFASKSDPVLERPEEVIAKVSHSLDDAQNDGEKIGQLTLRDDPKLTRLGTMFGANQFCYGEKPGGVEPGFRAIDINELFFKELIQILDPKNLSSENQPYDAKALNKLRDNLSKEEDLNQKKIIFAKFINSQVQGPHAQGDLAPGIKWLCDEVKTAVARNNQLSAWMYKLDYAERQKDRVKANKEAIREFVGTHFAGIFSEQNQKQEIAWVTNKEGGVHALLACGWKNDLKEFSEFLHGGSEPDYNGVLVEDKDAPVKESKEVPGLAKNLILGIELGDRDGMGKKAQNKGLADEEFYGFDYGKPYEGKGVASTLSDDFSFEDTFAKVPAIFRGSSSIGLARHFMYRNYSVFYDTALSERMEGFHLLRKMITGENPSEEVIESHPTLREELERIEKRTPSPQDLLGQLVRLKNKCDQESPFQNLIDAQIFEICAGKSNFDLYFAQVKMELLEMGINKNMNYQELADYIEFINEMQVTASNSNQQILDTFEKRRLLTAQEIDLLDHLEKYFSPTSVMSHDGEVFLRKMRFDPQSSRIPFQLSKETNGTYTLTTTNKDLVNQLSQEFGLTCEQNDAGLSCNIGKNALEQLIIDAKDKYDKKREDLLIKPTYKLITFPHLVTLLNQDNSPSNPKVSIGFLWREDNSLSLRITAKTEQQKELVKKIFGHEYTKRSIRVEIPSGELTNVRKHIEKTHEEYLKLNTKTQAEQREPTIPVVSQSTKKTNKWSDFHENSKAETQEKAKHCELLERFSRLIPDNEVLGHIKNVIEEVTDLKIIEQLLSYNDSTLSSPENVQAIVGENFTKVKVISDEMIGTQQPDALSLKQDFSIAR
ncbi:hypothetical protein [Fluoribacter gormanii]|uniref:Uncharacterized protein n=2 Tax=Fluoribacter gormanii TaxID=464 RepID=A0A377GLW2_9GAMM|nr:hypothetical protein [Fluoribacter gormanii]KTD05386.1 hypothetical protein Lgor_0376 [Fluoribacter gormanii]SIR62284.1 hypothetical protein SAMN05421777_11745 [Fluoribacter gormanii]STO25312.1 Uncharacterised protein [Fluoribacter gormanii]